MHNWSYYLFYLINQLTNLTNYKWLPFSDEESDQTTFIPGFLSAVSQTGSNNLDLLFQFWELHFGQFPPDEGVYMQTMSYILVRDHFYISSIFQDVQYAALFSRYLFC